MACVQQRLYLHSHSHVLNYKMVPYGFIVYVRLMCVCVPLLRSRGHVPPYVALKPWVICSLCCESGGLKKVPRSQRAYALPLPRLASLRVHGVVLEQPSPKSGHLRRRRGRQCEHPRGAARTPSALPSAVRGKAAATPLRARRAAARKNARCSYRRRREPPSPLLQAACPCWRKAGARVRPLASQQRRVALPSWLWPRPADRGGRPWQPDLPGAAPAMEYSGPQAPPAFPIAARRPS